MFEAKVICDSVSVGGKRITTFLLKYPRYIHSEVMTHRMLSKNASSSRAIPYKKMIGEVLRSPVIPIHFGKNKPGMQADQELSRIGRYLAKNIWLWARFPAIMFAYLLGMLGLHKQITTRILEPWLHINVICTGTEWDNFYHLRCSEHAHPDFRYLAEQMLEAHNNSVPKILRKGQWHLPLVLDEEFEKYEEVRDRIKFSVARCARVSYLNHDKSAPDFKKDTKLHDVLLSNGHMSPFEHQACPTRKNLKSGNLVGWKQYRKTLKNECVNHFNRLKGFVKCNGSGV